MKYEVDRGIEKTKGFPEINNKLVSWSLTKEDVDVYEYPTLAEIIEAAEKEFPAVPFEHLDLEGHSIRVGKDCAGLDLIEDFVTLSVTSNYFNQSLRAFLRKKKNE